METDDAVRPGVHPAIPAARAAPGNSQSPVLRLLESLPSPVTTTNPTRHRDRPNPRCEPRSRHDRDGCVHGWIIPEAENVPALRQRDFGPRGDHPQTDQGATMTRIPSPARSIVPRPPPATMPMRARREIDEICAPSARSGWTLFPRQPAVSADSRRTLTGRRFPQYASTYSTLKQKLQCNASTEISSNQSFSDATNH